MSIISHTALIFSILGIFIPIVGYQLVAVSTAFALLTIMRYAQLALVTALLNISNLLFWSPVLHSVRNGTAGLSQAAQDKANLIFYALLAGQLVIMAVFIAINRMTLKDGQAFKNPAFRR